MPEPNIDSIIAKYAGGGGSESTWQLKLGSDGQLYAVNPSEQKAVPVYGFPKEEAAKGEWTAKQRNDGSWAWINARTQQIKAAPELGGPEVAAPKSYEIGGNLVEYSPSVPRDPYADVEAATTGIPAQPVIGGAKVIYEDPYAEIKRKKEEADLQYKLRQLALLGAPPQRAPRFAEEIELDQLRAEELRQKLARYDEETAWKRAWEQEQEKGLNARQQMSTSANVFGNMGNLWQEAMKWAVPASGIPAGFEADSNYGRLLGSMIPGGYKPPQLTPVAFNPEALWKRAVGMVGGK